MNEDFRSTLAGLVLGLILVILIFGFLNYFRVLSLSSLFPAAFSWLPQRMAVSQQGLTGTEAQPGADTGDKFAGIPLDPDNALITDTIVLYTVKGKVNRLLETVSEGDQKIYVAEVVSLDGRNQYNFRIPEERIVEQGISSTGEKVVPGDDVQIVISVNLNNPSVLNYGSVYIIHDISQ